MQSILQGNTPVLQAGKLRHRLQICSVSSAQDTAGGITQTPVPIFTTWGSIEALTASEKFAAHEFVSQVTHKIIVRYRPNFTFTSALQVAYNGRNFQVEGVLNPDERAKTIILMCIEINDSTNQTPTAAESTL